MTNISLTFLRVNKKEINISQNFSNLITVPIEKQGCQQTAHAPVPNIESRMENIQTMILNKVLV